MTLGSRIALFCAVTVAPLALASTVHAAQSAVVGRMKTDGTIQLYLNRFQSHFADGTPVAKIEATHVGGSVRLQRRSEDGCQVESTDLVVGAATSSPWVVVSSTTASPLSWFHCEDTGCKDEFTYETWIGRCRNYATAPGEVLPCVCVRSNPSHVFVEEGDYCRRYFGMFFPWDMAVLVLPQFIEVD